MQTTRFEEFILIREEEGDTVVAAFTRVRCPIVSMFVDF